MPRSGTPRIRTPPWAILRRISRKLGTGFKRLQIHTPRAAHSHSPSYFKHTEYELSRLAGRPESCTRGAATPLNFLQFHSCRRPHRRLRSSGLIIASASTGRTFKEYQSCHSKMNDTALLSNQSARPLPCFIEALNNDVILAILSISASVEDLYAVIRASPAFLRCFLSNKRTVLLRVARRYFGPDFGEAVALARTKQIEWCDGYLDKVGDSLRLYHDALKDKDYPRSISMDEIIDVVQLVRVTEYFVGWCATSRLHIIDKMGVTSSWQATANERQRFARAILRFQLVTRIHPHGNLYDDEQTQKAIFGALVSPFQPWELEQLSAVLFCLYQLWEALILSQDRHHEDIPDPGTLPISDAPAPDQMIIRYSPPYIYEGMKAHVWNLAALKRKLEEDLRANEDLSKKIYGWFCYLDSRFLDPAIISGLDWETVTLGQAPVSDATREEEDQNNNTGRLDDDSSRDIPYGWLDAVNGRDWSRWGFYLVPWSNISLTTPDATRRRRAQCWRWLGFVFWDQDRIESLKESDPFKEWYHTGWLSTPQ